MLAQAHKELWAAAREELRCKLGDERFERWVAPLKVLSMDGSELRLGVPNRIVQDWLEKRYLPTIVSVLQAAHGGGLRVSLVIDPALYREHRRASSEVRASTRAGAALEDLAAPRGVLVAADAGAVGSSSTEIGVSPASGGGPVAPDAPLPHGPQARPPSFLLGPAALGPASRESVAGLPGAATPAEGAPAEGVRTRWEGVPLLPMPVSGGSTQHGDRKPEATLENFVVGASNHLAFNAVLQVLESPGALYNPLFLHGPSGVGKTHLLRGLAQALRSRRARGHGSNSRGVPQGPYLRALYVTGDQFFHHYASSVQDGTLRKFRERYRGLDVLIVDDVQLFVNKRKTQVEFLRTFSTLVDSARQVVLACDIPPRSIQELDPGLVGRFSSGLVVGIKKPDYATRLGILRLQASRLAVRLSEGILEFLAEHVRSTARDLVGALMKLDIHAQLGGGTLGLEQAREILADFVREAERRIDLKRIQDVVARHYALPPEAITSRSRQRHIACARQMAMFLARRHTKKSLAEIGKYFGNRNHTTVKCAENRIAGLLEAPEGAGRNISRDLKAILESLEE